MHSFNCFAHFSFSKAISYCSYSSCCIWASFVLSNFVSCSNFFSSSASPSWESSEIVLLPSLSLLSSFSSSSILARLFGYPIIDSYSSLSSSSLSLEARFLFLYISEGEVAIHSTWFFLNLLIRLIPSRTLVMS